MLQPSGDAVAFILACLDYCNSVLAGLLDHKFAKLQHIYRIVLPDLSFVNDSVKALLLCWKFFTGYLLKPG